ncbi:Uncharacterised protein [Empedobacter falsenii]|jgi:hypothetical protein|uniref:Uncharacterized protein n=1 Tax=Empedobacter falsenii TaxID=343874 RepID=A0A376G2Z5_9FLAO|nr:Uncharacterised protein [Empedobacter falsenii]
MQSKKISKSKKVGFGSKTINYKDIVIVSILIIVVALTILKFLNS